VRTLPGHSFLQLRQGHERTTHTHRCRPPSAVTAAAPVTLALNSPPPPQHAIIRPPPGRKHDATSRGAQQQAAQLLAHHRHRWGLLLRVIAAIGTTRMLGHLPAQLLQLQQRVDLGARQAQAARLLAERLVDSGI
jgi:hypothetical protein